MRWPFVNFHLDGKTLSRVYRQRLVRWRVTCFVSCSDGTMMSPLSPSRGDVRCVPVCCAAAFFRMHGARYRVAVDRRTRSVWSDVDADTSHQGGLQP